MEGRFLVGKHKRATITECRSQIAELKRDLEKVQKECKRLAQDLDDEKFAHKWTREKLIEKEVDNRNLKLIILRMTERESGDAIRSDH